MRMPYQMPARPSRVNQPIYAFGLVGGGLTLQQVDALKCSACCAGKAGFGACLARCLATGQACDGGISNCTPCT
jgi:hypothetical protein